MKVFTKIMASMHRPIYESRLKCLIRELMPYLSNGDSILDVGCGYGEFGKSLLEENGLPGGVTIKGIESVPRDKAHIQIDSYGGGVFPYEDNTFDIALVMDVLHHEKSPESLLKECMRVTKKYLVIKDHKVDGFLAQPRIAFLDWAANAPYGVPCLYRYNTPSEWEKIIKETHMKKVYDNADMDIYPGIFNWFFGKRLHYYVILKKNY